MEQKKVYKIVLTGGKFFFSNPILFIVTTLFNKLHIYSLFNIDNYHIFIDLI